MQASERVEVLSQRELRNESGRVLRAVSEGASFVVTNGGVPVGRLVPIDEREPGLPIVRPAQRRGGWADVAASAGPASRPLGEVLDDVRADR